MIRLRQLNNEYVKAIQLGGKQDNRPVQGVALFPEIYANILIFAKKKKGKTTVIDHIIKRCIDDRTIVYAFVSTLWNDDNWKAIKAYCKKKDIVFHGFTSLYIDGINKLDELVMMLEAEAKAREMAELMAKKGKKKSQLEILCDSDSDEEEEDKRKTRVPEYLIILDDISKLTRDKSVSTLMQQNRHYHCKFILSSQKVLDANVGSRENADYWLVFPGVQKKLEEILECSELPISFEEFEYAYHTAITPTEKMPKPFLLIDTNEQTLRKGFAEGIDIIKK